MESHPKKTNKVAQIFGILALFSIIATFGCEFNETPKTTSACSTGTAQIFIYDGVMKRVCGCTEGVGTFISNNPLNCTIAAGTRIYFHFINIQSQHQIAVTGIGSTRQMNVNTQSIDQVDASIMIPATGTYPFVDTNISTITGNFIVP